MPTIEQNRETWDSDLGWRDADGGERWSDWWGSADTQWRFAILPRIARFVPTGTVLEIAPGFGRWTHHLRQHCRRLVAIDLSTRCIDACRRRFADDERLEFHVNDGRSLPMVGEGEVDFAFSFDSLVHADADAIGSYVAELARVLASDGVAFIHHSNWGEYRRYADAVDLIPGRRVRGALERLRIIEGAKHWRARDMTAARFEALVRDAGLQCIGQELVNWRIRRLGDCFSILTRPTSRHARPNVVRRNPHFTQSARAARAAAAVHA